ncbi:CD59A glycoprotein [Hyalella azteca]|uniref:CD59A glycoprotein n=1 Tax=Hyalella azteca TaxID=294128 RepID=A0A8B7PH04_HYAAZ|nr:CD59A glycoprotein [Hyalella azteca]
MLHRRVDVTAALLLMLLLAQAPHTTDGLKCYICNNCRKFELSQSRTCPPEQDKCMKMDMETGQVQRNCGTETMCNNSDREMRTRYTSVNCCSEDNCNKAATAASPLLSAALLLPLHVLFVRCQFSA